MHRLESAGLVAYGFDSLPGERVDAIASTRTGGVSVEPYASLNLGLRVDDDAPLVMQNRKRFFTAFELDLSRSVWCRQVHADTVAVVAADDLGRGAYDEQDIITDTDALVTDLVDVPLVVTLADCVPVVIYDSDHHAVGLAHAGWGGTVARISSKTVSVMRDRYGTDPGDVAVAIGPSISPDRYEVGREVVDKAREAYGEGTADAFLTARGTEKARFDLWEANVRDLVSAGVRREQIEVSQISTIDDLDQFYSYRAERVTGRTVVAVRLLSPA